MAISVLMGPDHAGKTEALLRSLEDSADARYRVLLVPDQYKVETERLLGERNDNLLLFTKVMSLSGLAQRLLKGVAITPITRVGETLVISDILQENRSLSYFRSTTRPNALSGLVRIVDQMDAPLALRRDVVEQETTEQNDRSAGEKTGDRVDASSEIFAGGLSEVKPSFLLKLQDVNTIYEAYLSHLSGKYTDDARMTGLAAEYVGASEFVKNAYFFMNHYDVLSDNEAKLVAALSKHAKGFVAALDLGEGDVYAYTRRMLEKLPSSAKCVQMNPKDEASVFQRLSQQILGTAVEDADDALKMSEISDHVGIFSAEDMQQEVDFIASSVYRLMSEGTSPSKIAVLCTDLPGYRAALAVTLTKYGVPFFLESPISLGNNPLYEFIDGFLEVLQSRTEQRSDDEGLRKMLLSGIFPLPDDTAMAYYRKILERGSMFTGDPAFSGAEDVLSSLIDMGFKLSKKQRFSEMLRVLMQALLYEPVKGYSVREKCEQHSFRGEGDEKSYGARLWNRFIEAVEELHVLAEDVSDKSLKQLRELVATAFRQITIPVLPVEKEYVVVAPIDRARTHEISHLFVMGSLRGKLPAAIGQRSVFSATEVELLETSLSALGDAEEEAYYLHKLLTKPTERLIFTYPRDYADGYSKIFDLIRDDRDSASGKGRGFHEHVDAYLLRIGAEGSRQEQTPVETVKEIEGTDVDVRPIRGTPQDTWVWRAGFVYPSDETERCSLSASGVEDFAKCPALYFSSRKIRPAVLEPVGMTALSMGDIVHSVMELFFREGYYQTYLDIPVPERSAALQSLTEAAWNRVVSQYRYQKFFTGKGVSAVHEKNLKLDCERAVRVAIKQVMAGSLVPTKFEQKFVVQDEARLGKNVVFTGKIDRIDQVELEGKPIYRIIDYKTGKINLKRSDFTQMTEGEKIQLPAYAMVAELGGIEGIEPRTMCAGLYLLPASHHRNRKSLKEIDFRVQALQGLTNQSALALEAQFGNLERAEDAKDIVKTLGEKEAELPDLETLVEVASGTIRETAEQVREGVFDRVQSRANCTNCAYRYVCGLDMSMEVEEEGADGAE